MDAAALQLTKYLSPDGDCLGPIYNSPFSVEAKALLVAQTILLAEEDFVTFIDYLSAIGIARIKLLNENYSWEEFITFCSCLKKINDCCYNNYLSFADNKFTRALEFYLDVKLDVKGSKELQILAAEIVLAQLAQVGDFSSIKVESLDISEMLLAVNPYAAYGDIWSYSFLEVKFYLLLNKVRFSSEDEVLVFTWLELAIGKTPIIFRQYLDRGWQTSSKFKIKALNFWALLYEINSYQSNDNFLAYSRNYMRCKLQESAGNNLAEKMFDYRVKLLLSRPNPLWRLLVEFKLNFVEQQEAGLLDHATKESVKHQAEWLEHSVNIFINESSCKFIDYHKQLVIKIKQNIPKNTKYNNFINILFNLHSQTVDLEFSYGLVLVTLAEIYHNMGQSLPDSYLAAADNLLNR